jgi:3-isopropylmalate dehydrogenase
MQAFTTLTGRAGPLLRENIDTDIVIRINRLIENKKGQLGPYCFEAIRYAPDGAEDPAFPLNQDRFRGAEILVAGDNFGCGSSREAAVWAIMDYGIKCVIAPSFGDIFAANAFQNGLLTVRLTKPQVDRLADELNASNAPEMTVDLTTTEIRTPRGATIAFSIDAERREALLAGLDEIGMTLKEQAAISAFRAQDVGERPWIYRQSEAPVTKSLLILAGDGIGPEIMPEVRRVAKWFKAKRDVALDLEEEHFGILSWKTYGSLMPDATWEKVTAADAILFGAIGSPEYDLIPAEAKKQDQLLRMRRELDTFINFRPVKAYKPLLDASSLRADVLEGTDMVIVRELAGGVYFGEPRGISVVNGEKRAVNTVVYTESEIRRIARAAFELARTRSGKVCSVDKANVLEFGRLWRETVQALRDAEYPDIALSHMYVDNAAMQLVRSPTQFDVMVTENLFGDILSDCAAMASGSLGMLPSASLSAPDANGRRNAIYEPIHGSAPDIAGKGIANPIGAIMSFAMCLRYTFNLPQDAHLLETAVIAAVESGVRTADIVGMGMSPVSTSAMGDAILAQLEALAG